MSNKSRVKIDRYNIIKVFDKPVLVGDVYYHPKLNIPIGDSQRIITSPIKKIDFTEGFAETNHTYYDLGEMSLVNDEYALDINKGESDG